MKKDPEVDLISVPDAARRIGVCPDTLYKLIRADIFPPAIRLGRKRFVSVPKLERFLHGTTETEGVGESLPACGSAA